MSNLYYIFLLIHSWNRWIVLIAALVLFTSLIITLSKRAQNNKAIKISSITFLSSVHFQLLVGIILYFFLSPYTQIAFNDFGSAMGNSELRFWAIEHTLLNLIGITLIQVGYSKSKKTVNDRANQKTLLMWMGLGFILIILAIPMGLMSAERPWMRF
jgi:heme A synthase